MLGGKIEGLVSWLTALHVFVKPLFDKFILNHPELTKKLGEKIIEISKNGRDRNDEMAFISSLSNIPNTEVSDELKELFLEKHAEMLFPDFTGKAPDQIVKLKKMEKMAKGIIFLIAEDKSIEDPDPTKRHILAKEIWKMIFFRISVLPNKNAKLAALEQRIMHFGKNNQDKVTLEELIEKSTSNAKAVWIKIDSIADSIGDEIGKATTWINDQYNKKENRAIARRAKIATNKWHRINPIMWFEWFRDQF